MGFLKPFQIEPWGGEIADSDSIWHLQDCIQMCLDNEFCTHYNYNITGNHCWLLDRIGGGYRTHTGNGVFVSGPRTCPKTWSTSYVDVDDSNILANRVMYIQPRSTSTTRSSPRR